MSFIRRGDLLALLKLVACCVVIVVSTLIFPGQVFCYDSHIAHSNIARMAAILYNKTYPDVKLSAEEINWIIEGAEEEDTPTRWMNHFYDPVHNIGLKGMELSAKAWAQNPTAQTKFSLGDRSWPRAIDDFRKNNKRMAFIELGHTIHLISDMAVPAHTRNDIHAVPPDSLEQYAKNNWNNVYKSIRNTGEVINTNEPGKSFDNLAKYSNNNFYSDDTVGSQKYTLPAYSKFVENITPDGVELYAINSQLGNKLFRASAFKGDWKNLITRNNSIISGPPLNNVVLTDYATHLIPKAIGYSAGVIKLFLDEAQDNNYKISSLPKSRIGLGGWVDSIVGFFVSTGADVLADVEGQLKNGDSGQEQKPTEMTLPTNSAGETKVSVAVNKVVKSPVNKTPSIPKNYQDNAENSRPPDKEIAIPNSHVLPQTTSSTPKQNVVSTTLDTAIGTGQNTFYPQTTTDADKNGATSTPPQGGGATTTLAAPTLSGQFEATIFTITSSTIISGECASNSLKLIAYFSDTAAGIKNESGVLECGGVTTSWQYEVLLHPGHNFFSFLATNSAATSSFSTPAHFVLDNDAPPIPQLTATTINPVLLNFALTGTDALSTTYYDLEYKTSTLAGWIGIAYSSPSSTISFQSEPGGTYFFRARAIDQVGNTSAWSDTAVSSTPVYTGYSQEVVINEIAWAGTSAANSSDEWIELYNNTDSLVDLNNWKLIFSGKEIKLTKIINPRGYYLLERTDDRTVLDIAADQIFTLAGGIKNSGEDVVLINSASGTVDAINCASGWFAGDNVLYRTMERKSSTESGSNPDNWQNNKGLRPTGVGDGGALLYGSPRQSNFGNILLSYDQSESTRVLGKEDNPYILRYYGIPAGKSLQVKEGVVIKSFLAGAYLDIYGMLSATGTADAPVVFTSGRDTDFADSNTAAVIGNWPSSTPPQARDWAGIRLYKGAKATLNNVKIRYAGNTSTVAGVSVNQAIKAQEAVLDINDSEMRDNGKLSFFSGLSTSTVKNCKFEAGERAMETEGGKIVIEDSSFSNFTNDTGPLFVKNIWPEIKNIAMGGNILDAVRVDSAVIGENAQIKIDLPMLLNNITVTSSAVLDLDPGAKILLPKFGYLNIGGALNANGTGDKPIFFEPFPSTTKWGYIRFKNSTSTLNYTNFVGGNLIWANDVVQMGTDGALIVDDSSVVLNNCSVWNSRAPKKSVMIRNSHVEMSNSVIGHDEKPGDETIGIEIKNGSLKLDSIRFQNLNYTLWGLGDPLPALEMNNMTEENFVNVDEKWIPGGWYGY